MYEIDELAEELYQIKLKKYGLRPDIMTDNLKNQLRCEATREALMQCATFGGQII